MKTNRAGSPLERLRHHVTGAVERGEAEPIRGMVEFPPARRPDYTLSSGRTIERNGVPIFSLTRHVMAVTNYSHLDPYQLDSVARQVSALLRRGDIVIPDTVEEAERLEREASR